MNVKPFRVEYMMQRCGLFDKYPVLHAQRKDAVSFIVEFAKGKSEYQRKAKYFVRRMCFYDKPQEIKSFIEYLETNVCHYQTKLITDMIPFTSYAKYDLAGSKIVHFLEDFCGKPIDEILNHFCLLNMYKCYHNYGYQSKYEAYLKYHGDIIKKIFNTHLIMFLASMFFYIKLAMETNTIKHLSWIYLCGMNFQNTKQSEKIIFKSFFDFVAHGETASTIFEKSQIKSYLVEKYPDDPDVIEFTKKLYSKLEYLYYFFINRDMEQIKSYGQSNIDFNLVVGRFLSMKSSSIKKFVTFKNLWLLLVIDENDITFTHGIKTLIEPIFSDHLLLEI